MAQYDGSIRIDTLIDQRGFDRGSRSLIQGMTRLGNSLNGLIGALGLGLSLVGLVSLGKQAIETASDIQEVQNVVDTAFGDMSYKMERFADTAIKQFGISKLSAKQMGSTFAAMGRSMVGSMEDATDMAIALTGRAADMASFYNKSFEETSTALKSIYTGETETLKQYGVVMTEVNLQEYAAEKGIKKKISAMTQAEKVQLRYNYVMEQTSLAAGDFVKTSNSWANQTRILSEQFKELLSILGSGLITVLTPVIKFLNNVLSMLIAIAKQVGAILSKLFGISIPTVQTGKLAQDMTDAAAGAGDLAEGIEEAGKAANKAVAPFDKLNVLNQDKDGSSGASGGIGAGGGFEMPEVEIEESDVAPIDDLSNAIDDILEKAKPLFDWFKKLKELFKEGFFDGLGESWKERVADIIESAKNIGKSLKEIFTDPTVVEAAKTMVEKIIYALGQIVGSVASMGLTIAQNIIGGIDKYLEQNKEFLKEKLVSIFDITGEVAAQIGEACASIAYIFEAFGSESGQQLTANIIGIFTNTIASILELALKFGRDILNCILQPIIDNEDALRTALENFLGVLADITGRIKERIEEAFENLNQLYDEKVKPFLEDMEKRISEWVATDLIDWIDNFGQSLKKAFDWISENEGVVKSLIVNVGLLTAAWKLLTAAFAAWNTAAPIVTTALQAISTVLSGELLSGTGILTKLANTFLLVAGGAGTLHEALVTIFGTMATTFAGIASVVGGIITAVTNFISMLQNGFNAINEVLMLIGIALTAIGAIILGAPALVAGIVAAVVAAAATIVTVIHDNWDAICEWFSGAADWINENVIQPVISFFQGLWSSVSGFFSSLWNDIVGVWSAASGWFSSAVIEPIASFFQGLLTRVQQIFEGLWLIVQAVWIVASTWFNDNVITPIVTFFQELWTTVSEFFTQLWEDICELWTTVSTWFDENVIIPVTDFFRGLWEDVSGFFSELWEDIKAVWSVVFSWFDTNIITPVKNAFRAVCDAIGGYFSSLWQGIRGGVVSAMNAVISGIEGAINFIVSGINSILSGFNDVASWAANVVGVDWGGVSLVPTVSLGRIPALADGAVIRGGDPFVAVLGDQRHGQTNIETPLPTMVKAFKQALAESGNTGGGTYTFVAQLDGRTLFEETVKQNDIYFYRTGSSAFLF